MKTNQHPATKSNRPLPCKNRSWIRKNSDPQRGGRDELRETRHSYQRQRATGSASALPDPQLAVRTLNPQTSGHQKPEKIFVEIGPPIVLTCITRRKRHLIIS